MHPNLLKNSHTILHYIYHICVLKSYLMFPLGCGCFMLFLANVTIQKNSQIICMHKQSPAPHTKKT